MAKINSCIGIVLVLSTAAAFAHADAAGVSVTFHGPRTVRFVWDDTARCLTISERGGAKYPGRIEKRRFRVRLPGREPVPIEYTGARLTVNF